MSGNADSPIPQPDPEMDGKMVLPLVIRDEHAQTLAVSRTSDKGFRKSTEQRRLWVIHPETGRLVPDDADLPLLSISAGQGFYDAIVRTGLPAAEGNGSARSQPLVTGETGAATESPVGGHHRVGAAEFGPGRTAAAASGSGQTEAAAILGELQELIRERARTLPEGSYTTHLLQSGPDKIRKKLGEEAVELLLAKDSGELRYEAADLIYHLLVLLVAENADIMDVLLELRRRH